MATAMCYSVASFNQGLCRAGSAAFPTSGSRARSPSCAARPAWALRVLDAEGPRGRRGRARCGCRARQYDRVEPPLQDGDRVHVHGRPELFTRTGELSLRVHAVARLGLGDLLARLERLKTALAAEGLFAADRKQPLPRFPRLIGLVCGRDAAAKHDVVENARRRFPSARFEIVECAVQGAAAPRELVRARRPARPTRRGRRDRARPRRRLAGGPRGVLRRGTVPRDRGVHDAGRVGHRSRAGHPAVRPRRRRARVHAHPRRPPDRARRRRARPRCRRPRSTAPAGRSTAGWRGSAARSSRSATGPYCSDRRGSSTCAARRCRRPATGCRRCAGPAARAGARAYRRRRPPAAHARPRRDARPRLRDRHRRGRARAAQRDGHAAPASSSRCASRPAS